MCSGAGMQVYPGIDPHASQTPKGFGNNCNYDYDYMIARTMHSCIIHCMKYNMHESTIHTAGIAPLNTHC